MASSPEKELSKVPDGIDTNFNIVSEGKATILQPTTVFYNPVQEFNRDLTIAFISEFAEEHAKEMKERKRKQLKREKEKHGETDLSSQGKETKYTH